MAAKTLEFWKLVKTSPSFSPKISIAACKVKEFAVAIKVKLKAGSAFLSALLASSFAIIKRLRR
jgi:hypothetical protein